MLPPSVDDDRFVTVSSNIVVVAVGTLTYGSSSSSRKRYVLQYTKLNSAKTSGNVMREMTSIRFDLEHFLKDVDKTKLGKTREWVSYVKLEFFGLACSVSQHYVHLKKSELPIFF
jgi:hypothetical protein